MKEFRYKTYKTNKWFTVLLQKKDFFSFEMLAKICKAMTFSRYLKYKWKGNRWSVAIVAAKKNSAFELPVIHYIHVINANAGRAFLSLCNVCSVTTCVTRLLTRFWSRDFAWRTSSCALLACTFSRALPLFSIQHFGCVTTSLFRKPKIIAMKEHIYIT